MSLYVRINNGIVAEKFELNGDIYSLFNSSQEWVAISDGVSAPDVGDEFDGTTFTKPYIAVQDPIFLAKSKRDELIYIATQVINKYQDAADLYKAGSNDLEMLVKWKSYRYSLNNIEVDSSGSTEWPATPEAESL